jgi:DNA-binding transcriptional regulator YiaG
VKNANAKNIAFLRDVIKASNPDFAAMRSMVQQALQPKESSNAEPQEHVDTLSDVCAYKED